MPARAYVFTRSGAEWSQQAYIKASNTGEGDVLGYSLALSGDGSILAVGALNEDSTNGLEADDSAQDAGAVYIFTRSGTTWRQKAYLKASNADTGDAFGSTVALSADGSTLAVGADAEDSGAVGIGDDQADNSAENAGAVYVFARSGTTWSQQYVKASNTGARDRLAPASRCQATARPWRWEPPTRTARRRVSMAIRPMTPLRMLARSTYSGAAE